jgi:hypothetical protein
VGFVRPGDRLEGRGSAPKLGIGEAAGEVIADPPQVRARCSSQQSASPIGQPCQRDPGVSLEPIPLDEAGPGQPIHHPGQPARREHHSLGELAHTQAVSRSTSQTEQNVVGPEGEAVLLLQFRIQARDHLVMGVKEGLPGAQLRFGELVRHECSLATWYLRVQLSP